MTFSSSFPGLQRVTIRASTTRARWRWLALGSITLWLFVLGFGAFFLELAVVLAALAIGIPALNTKGGTKQAPLAMTASKLSGGNQS